MATITAQPGPLEVENTVSIHVMSWVLRNSEERLGNRLVLLVLADHADDQGHRAFPAVETIAREARMSERQARSCLRSMEQSGAIEFTGTLRSGTRIYSVKMGAEESAPRQNPPPEKSGTSEPDSAPESSLPVRTSSSSSRKATARMPKSVGGKAVTEDEHDTVDALLGRFNERAGGKSFAGKEWRESIVRRMREHPEITVFEHLSIIDKQFERPWWKGDATPSVIWGNGKTFDRALNGAQGPEAEEDRFTRD